jgi:hypothetical protein
MANLKKKKWTVFFLVKALGKKISPIVNRINEIRSIPLNENLAIVFCFNVLKENISAIEKGDTNIMAHDDSPETPTTCFYSLTSIQNTEDYEIFNQFKFISENQEFDLTDPYYVEDYFRKFILNPFKAERYILFTFDHGNAFRIFPEKVNDPLPITKALTMEELNTAIRGALGNRKIDLVVMMNCYMQSMMTGFALHRSVKYLIAPESDMDFSGYNYVSIFNTLINNPDISSRKLAKFCVSSFPKKIYSDYTSGEYNKNNTAIFALKLKYFKLFPSVINQFLKVFSEMSAFPFSTIKAARNDTTLKSKDDLADFYAFLKNITKNEKNNKLTIWISLLCTIIEQVIIEGHVGDNLKKKTDMLLTSEWYNGISIYFPLALKPEDIENVNSRINQFLISDFGRRTKWKELISKMIECEQNTNCSKG